MGSGKKARKRLAKNPSKTWQESKNNAEEITLYLPLRELKNDTWNKLHFVKVDDLQTTSSLLRWLEIVC